MCSCLGLLQRSFSGFVHEKFCQAGWFEAGHGYLGEREFTGACLQPQQGQGTGTPRFQSSPVPEAGHDHKCDSSCIYPALLIHKTRMTIPAVARAGFSSGGSRRGAGAVVPDPISAQSCLLRALTFCLQWNDPSRLERCSDFLKFPPFYVHQELLASVAAKAVIAGLCITKSSFPLKGTGSK